MDGTPVLTTPGLLVSIALMSLHRSSVPRQPAVRPDQQRPRWWKLAMTRWWSSCSPRSPSRGELHGLGGCAPFGTTGIFEAIPTASIAFASRLPCWPRGSRGVPEPLPHHPDCAGRIGGPLQGPRHRAPDRLHRGPLASSASIHGVTFAGDQRRQHRPPRTPGQLRGHRSPLVATVLEGLLARRLLLTSTLDHLACGHRAHGRVSSRLSAGWPATARPAKPWPESRSASPLGVEDIASCALGRIFFLPFPGGSSWSPSSPTRRSCPSGRGRWCSSMMRRPASSTDPVVPAPGRWSSPSCALSYHLIIS